MKNGLHITTFTGQAEEKNFKYIKKNHLIPGTSLPDEMQFSEMMGISRNVVREALCRLRMLGLIQSHTKRGRVVTEPPLLNGFKKVLDPIRLSIEPIDMMGTPGLPFYYYHEKWDISQGYDQSLLAGLTFVAKGAVGSSGPY